LLTALDFGSVCRKEPQYIVFSPSRNAFKLKRQQPLEPRSVRAIMVVCCALVAAGVSARGVMVIALFHIVVSAFTFRLFKRLDIRSQLISLVDLVGVTSLLAFVYVIFVSIESSSFRILLVVGCIPMCVLLLRGILMSLSCCDSRSCLNKHDKFDESAVLIVGLLILSFKGFLPLLPTAVSLFLWHSLSMWRVGTASLRISSFLVVLSMTFISRVWADRDEYWFWISYDQQFRASLATGLMRWGYRDWNSAAGTTVHYHWLAEALSGLLSRATGQDEWLIVTRVAPLILFLSAITAAWRFLISGIGKPNTALVAISVVSLLLLEFDPYSIGILLGLTLAARSLELLSRRGSGFQASPYLLVLVGLTLMSQAPVGLALASVLCCVCVYRGFRYRNERTQRLLAVLAVLGTALALRTTILRAGSHSAADARIELGRVLQFGGYDVPFGLDSTSPWWLRVGNSLSFILELSLVALPGLLGLIFSRRENREHERGAHLEVMCSLFIGPLLLMNVLNLGIAQGKLVSITLSSLLPLSVAVCLDQIAQRKGLLTRTTIAIGVLATSFAYAMSRSIKPDFIAAVSSVMLLMVGAFVLLGLVVGLVRKRLRWASSVIVLTLPLIVFGILAGRLGNARVYLQREQLQESQYFGTEDVVSCFMWIRNNSSKSSIVATNLFDPPTLPGSGKSHLASLVSKRRIWLDGLYMKKDSPKLLRDRLDKNGLASFDPGQVDFLVGTDPLYQATSQRHGLELVYSKEECSVWKVIS